MILVTVGTTLPFDELLAEVDRLAGAGLLDEPVVCQGGQSGYRLSHGEQFIGRPSIDDLIAGSSMVVTHGGATVIQLLLAGRPFVAFPNPRGAGDHQTSFLRTLSTVAQISWSRDVGDLHRLLRERRALGPAAVPAGFPRAADLIRALIRPPAS